MSTSVPGNSQTVSVGAGTNGGNGGGIYNTGSLTLTGDTRWPTSSYAANLSGISCLSPTHCVAVRQSSAERGATRPLIYSWNGYKWTVERSASTTPSEIGLTGVSCTSGAACVAVGVATDKLGTTEAFSELWNGRYWEALATPTPGSGGELEGIQCMSASFCSAVGSGQGGQLTEKWAVPGRRTGETRSSRVWGVRLLSRVPRSVAVLAALNSSSRWLRPPKDQSHSLQE